MANSIVSNNRGFGGFAWIGRTFESWKADRRKARVFNATRKELRALSARELADIGISASEISAIAHRAAYGTDA